MSNVVKLPRRPPTELQMPADAAMLILQGVRERAGPAKAAELAYGFLLVCAGIVRSEFGADHAARLLEALARDA